MTRESVRAKGLRILTEGRVIVDQAGHGTFSASVRDSGDVHAVTFGRGGWACTCLARSTCSHLHACWLIAAPNAVPGMAS